VRAIDLFAGWGGMTLAALLAEYRVVWAGNHWPLAVDAHAENHPETVHVCQDLRQMNWADLPDFDAVLASPSCQPHSTASQPGRRPYHDAMRATAWAVIDCVEVTSPRAVVVENVPAFRRWALYPLWRAALERLGYHVQELLVECGRLGVPQRRTRLFVVALRRPERIELPVLDEVPFAPCVEQDAAGWRPVTRAMPGAQERIEKGRRNHGRRFLTQHVTGHPGVSLDEPIRTITTKDQWALVDGDVYRPLTVRETARAMSFPDSYRWPSGASRRDCIIGLGNAVPPVAARELLERVRAAA
jgi:DNA (cytosine-5)-methyltransferase 1